ncbi:hypothetical protein SDRG_03465 [Saprolegnia diclina VS20]|uniref:HEAT repeat-containing protein 1 n=1 Tax=Saprolegnia diclina (strain VS20) TaxID=1156394 RepID=T0QYV0_SAPDV|nr:hypothetical protein SDRG_03465 [Saprolegnia diclina VS20]EQC39260.1 hypothetical protein SDRG_03465 [Saprolegnia diclina VS20]|eukprot:XP_008607321.1 hypothetical protein SDRG_03465 [Saprolegnia diclina VS20]
MSTSSLASQLHALQVQTTSASSQRTVASFLHEPKVAAKIDGRTTFELAKTGMETLCSMDGSLDVFQHTLLHPNKAHAQYSRMLLTKEEVVALDLELGLLLDALSPYFLLPPTHQVIEFLVRKYEIHVWNVDQILAMTICYHESPVFARLITICDLAKHPRWAFLEHVKTNNVPLLRANLSKRCFADYSLVSFLHTAAVRIGARNAKLIALYALVAMEILEKSRVSEHILRWVLPNIVDGLKDKSFPERQTAAYMVATKLTTHATLSPAARQQLVIVIAKTAPAHAQFDAFLCLIGVLQSQPFETFPTDALKHIFKFDDIPQLLMDAMEAYDTTKFLGLFLEAVALAHAHATSEQLFLDVTQALGQIVAPFVASLVRSMLSAAHATPSVADRLQRLLLFLSKRYPEPFDAGLNAMLTDASLDTDLQSFCVNFVSTSFTGTAAALHVPLAESGVSLLLSLDHPTVSVRLHALSVLADVDAAALEDPDVLLRRLNDDAPNVIVAALSPAVASLLLQTASANQLLEQIAVSLNARAFHSAFATAMTALVTFVTGPFRDTHGSIHDATILDMLLAFAPQSTVLATKPVVAWSTVAPLLATLSVAPFTDGLSTATKDIDVLGHFGSQTTLAAASIVEAWALPSVHRHTALPLLVMRILNDGRQATTPELATPLLSLLTTTWTGLNASTPIESVDRPRIAEMVEVICNLMRTSFKKDALTYDAALVLLLSSTSAYFTLVQPVLHAALASDASHWTDLFHSLCRLVHTDAPSHVLTRSVMLLSVMIECTPSMVSIDDVHHVVLALLVALSHAHTALRNAAAQCLKPLSKLSLTDKKGRDAFAVYTPTLTALLKVKEELSMDASYVATFCSAHVSKDKAFLSRVLTTALVPQDALSSTLLQRVRNVLRVLHLVHLDSVWTTTIGWFTSLLKTNLTPLTASIGADLLSHYLRAPASATFEVVLATVASPSAAPLHSHLAKTMEATWFSALPMGKQTTLVQALVVLLRTGADSTPSDVASLLVRLSLPVRIVTGLLAVKSERSWVAQTTCVLEVVSNLIANYAVDDLNALLSPLHAVLAQFVAAKDDVSEYSVQMVLSALHGVAVGLRGHASSTTHATSFVELTLRVVQHTVSQQTRNAALLFVSSLVDLCPTHVLQSLVPILTFASQLQLDEYSFHVLQEIVTHAVPYVHTDASDISTQQFLATFVAAYETLPIGRRTTLFNVLLTALGAHDDDAAAIAVTLLLQHATDVPARSAFCHTLLEALDADLQMRALVSLLSIAGQLHAHLAPRANDDEDDEDEDDEADVAFVIDPKLANATLDRIVSFVPRHLERKGLHHQLLDNSDVEKSLQHAYLLLAQGILLFLRRVTKTKEALAAKKNDMADRWDAIAATALEAMNNLQQLLTAPGFVAVIGELLQHEDGVIRRRALQLLNERIEETEATLTFEEELLFVDMLDDLSSVLEDPSALLTDKQMAILSVDVLTRFFAHKHAQPFLNILPTVMACCKLPLDVTANGHVIGSAFVCLSNLCHSLGPAVFPFVPQFFPTLLTCLDASTSASSADASLTLTLQQCLLAAMRAMTTKFPQFLVSYLPKMLHLLFVPSLLNVHHVQIRASVDATILALANGIELRNLLPALMELYPVCCGRGDVALLRFFEMVTAIVTGMDRAAVKAHMAGLMRLYLVALDLRRLHPTIGEHVEDQLIGALLALVMKLSEKQLKPLFLKLVSWVDVVLPHTQGPSHARQLVFFRVVSQLSEKLKSIFVPYFAHILPLCASILLSAIDAGVSMLDAENTDGFFERPSKKAKKDVVVVDQWPLAAHVVTALIGCFSHDTDGFMDKEKFDVVMPPLVDLLGLASLEVARPVVDGAVVALAHLAWAAKNDLLWKPMHHRILMKSRAEEPAVRLATLQTIEQCYAIVGEEFLAMLPESIPFLAELLEDHDANVEALCHKVIRQIEDISGESLDQYLTA